jgi:hypothetical protein
MHNMLATRFIMCPLHATCKDAAMTAGYDGANAHVMEPVDDFP